MSHFKDKIDLFVHMHWVLFRRFAMKIFISSLLSSYQQNYFAHVVVRGPEKNSICIAYKFQVCSMQQRAMCSAWHTWSWKTVTKCILYNRQRCVFWLMKYTTNLLREKIWTPNGITHPNGILFTTFRQAWKDILLKDKRVPLLSSNDVFHYFMERR